MDATEFEIEIDPLAGYDTIFETEGDSDGTFFIVVEHLDGSELTDVEVTTVIPGTEGDVIIQDGFAMQTEPQPEEHRIGNIALEGASDAEIQAFAGKLPAAVTGIRVRIGGNGNRRVRIFVGWVKGFWPKTPCDQCRAIVRAVLRVVKATGGDIGITDLAEAILTFVTDTLGARALDVLGDVLDAVNWIGRAIDGIATEVCKRLGYCP